MNNFKVTKSGKYFKTEFIKFKPENYTIKYHWSNSNLHENKTSTEKYIKLVVDIEKQISKELKERGLNFKATKLVVVSLKIIESWSDEFDIRHDIGLEKQAKLIVNSYSNSYNKAKEENKSILEKISANGKGGYDYNKKNWKEEEKYKNNNDLYELGMESLKEYYGEDPFYKIIKKTEDLIARMGIELEKSNKSREDNMKDLKVGDSILIPSSRNKQNNPDITAIVEEKIKQNLIKARVHSNLVVEVPTVMIKFKNK